MCKDISSSAGARRTGERVGLSGEGAVRLLEAADLRLEHALLAVPDGRNRRGDVAQAVVVGAAALQFADECAREFVSTSLSSFSVATL